ncbi:MAG: hypothetical protein M3O06_03420 [Pseudomonadota bacterium]|nr:hypothetical protein [Pseudomonadota bacterium]
MPAVARVLSIVRVLRRVGAARFAVLAAVFLRAVFFAVFFATRLLRAAVFAERAFFLTVLLLTVERFVLPIGRFFALVFFFAMITFLLAV